jgi:hypothetical protein
MTRAGVVGLVLGLAAYVTGLQKLVLDPILSGFRDLAPSAQLAILAGLVAVIALVLGLRARTRRAELARAAQEVARNLGDEGPGALVSLPLTAPR